MGKKDTSERFFNAPIAIYEEFLNPLKSDAVLSNVLYYSLHVWAIKHNLDIDDAADCFGVQLGNSHRASVEGRKLYLKYLSEKVPMVGISKDLLFRYLNQDKTEFEKVCLLAFLAIKSILGERPYFKVNNTLLLARMSGLRSIKDGKITKELQGYSTRYQIDKIKSELESCWGITIYGYHTRGWYVSKSLNPEQLALEAEKNRHSNKKRAMINSKRIARELAMRKILMRIE